MERMSLKPAAVRIAPDDPLGVSSADLAPACPLTPAEVIGAWNALCEDHGPLPAVLLEFAEGLFRLAAQNHRSRVSSDSSGTAV